MVLTGTKVPIVHIHINQTNLRRNRDGGNRPVISVYASPSSTEATRYHEVDIHGRSRVSYGLCPHKARVWIDTEAPITGR